MNEKVKVYSTPTCNLCDRAKEFFAEKGIDYDTIDITKDSDGLQEMRRISRGARSAPVISVCDKVLVGFNKEELEKAVSCL